MNKVFTTLIAASLCLGATAPLPLVSRGMEIPTDESQKAKPATIKVLLVKNLDRVLLEGRGRHSVFNPVTNLPLTDSSFSKRAYIHSTENGLVWGELIPGNDQIRLVPGDTNSSVLVNGIEYRGCIEVYTIRDKLFIVNEVDIERYLKSTMTTLTLGEMDDEVMDAVAIVARTNAYYLASRTPSAPWHVDASDVDYQGCALTLQNQPVERAINNTRFMTLTYKGLPFPATWTKDSAGKTAEFASMFRKDVKTPRGVNAPFAAHNKEARAWSFSISKQDLAKALGSAKVSSFDLYQDEKTKKVYGARVKEDVKSHQFDFAALQKALGAARLKSNDFQVQTAGDKIIFKGYGEGNGVGLCLYSANAMSDKGEKAPKILASFFPESKLANIRSFEDMERLLRTSE